MLRGGTRVTVQIHSIHQLTGDMDIGFRDATFGFGQMPHHLKSGSKKQRLAFTLVGKPRHFAHAGFVEHVAN